MMFLTTQNGFLNKSFSLFVKNFDLFMYGIKMTLILAFLGTMLGLVIGLVLGGLRAITIEPRDLKSVKVLKKMMHCLIGLYVWFFRGTPMMVQAMFLYHALRPILGWSSLTAGIVIISVNTGAYMAEIIRSGIQSVDKGQREAAKSLGMSNVHMMTKIIIPQAIKNILPALGNEFVMMIKETSLASTFYIGELMTVNSVIKSATYKSIEPLVIVGLIYFIVTYSLSKLIKYMEGKLSVSD